MADGPVKGAVPGTFALVQPNEDWGREQIRESPDAGSLIPWIGKILRVDAEQRVIDLEWWGPQNPKKVDGVWGPLLMDKNKRAKWTQQLRFEMFDSWNYAFISGGRKLPKKLIDRSCLIMTKFSTEISVARGTADEEDSAND